MDGSGTSGTDAGPEDVLGTLDDFPASSGFAITPLVATLSDIRRLHPNADEVHSVHRAAFALPRLADGRLRPVVDRVLPFTEIAAAYHARIRDALVPFEVESAPGRQYFRNAAGARHRGIELLAEVARGPVEARAAFALTDAEFTTFRTAEETYDGLRVPGVRPWTASADLTWRPAATLALALDWAAAGAMAVDDANTVDAPAHDIVGIRAAIPLRVRAWTVRLHGGVDNVLDAPWVASVVPNAFGGRFFEPGPGRSFHVGLGIAGTP